MKTIKIVCRSCGGTGLYKGLAEGGKCAVVCHTCNGSGCDIIEYEPFKKRKLRKDIKRVFKDSCGYGHTDEDFTRNGQTVHFSKAGVKYKEWLKGKKPLPVKDLYCPYLWTEQNMQLNTHPKHDIYECRCNKGISVGSRINTCRFWEDKAECWKLFEETKNASL